MKRASVHFNPEFANSSQLVTAVESLGFIARRLKVNDDHSETSKHSEEEYLKLRSRMKFAMVFSAPLVLLAMAPMLGFLFQYYFSETEPLNNGLIQLLLVLPVCGQEGIFILGFCIFHAGVRTWIL